MKILAALGVLIICSPLAAQRAAVQPGMTEPEVRRILGEPEVVRRVSSRAYLFYANGCPIRCGMDDVVFLDNGRVTRVFLRAPTRSASGVRMTVPGSRGVSVGRSPRRIVVGPRPGATSRPADGLARPAGAVGDTVRGPLQRSDTTAALRPPTPVPGTPPADTAAPRPLRR